MKKREVPPPRNPSGAFPVRPLLYVEDNDDNWAVADLRLGSKFLLMRAKNDREACETLIKDGPRLCAVLMDIELQGSQLDGIELTRLMRGISQRPNLPTYATAVPKLSTPVIFVTAYNQVYSEDALRAAGGDKVMSKPVDFPALNLALMNLQVARMSGGSKKTP